MESRLPGERALRLVRFFYFLFFSLISFLCLGASCADSSPLKYRVTSVAFSPNGKQVVSGSDDKSVKLWSIETGTAAALSTMTRHSDTVSSVAFSADGRWVMSGSSDKTIRLWDTHAVAQ
jgi:WD40 repeat protein